MKSNKHQAGVERLMKVNSEEDLENIIAGEYGEAYTSHEVSGTQPTVLHY